jgi:adenosyl cobinamide kinase/adenosyl cobinamide phosphate guanylyltransferase
MQHVITRADEDLACPSLNSKIEEKGSELLARVIHVLEVGKGMATIHQVRCRMHLDIASVINRKLPTNADSTESHVHGIADHPR